MKANNTVSAEQQSQLRQRQAQEQESTARENEKARLATQKAKSSATVAAGEAGVEGQSVDSILQEYDANLGQFREATRRQEQFKAYGINAESDAIQTGGQYKNLQINAPVTKPNYSAALLKWSSNAVQAANDYRQTPPAK